MRAAFIIALLTLAGCEAPTDTPPADRVSRGMASAVSAYDMKDGVRCYVLTNSNGNELSCMKL